MDYLVKQAKTGISPSLCQYSPSQFLYDPSYTCLPIEVTDSPAGRPFLDLFNLVIRLSVCGSHTAEAYSSCGLTRVLYAVSRNLDIFVLILRRIKPRVRFAFPVMRSTWEFQERSLEISTPRDLAHVTASKIWPCSK